VKDVGEKRRAQLLAAMTLLLVGSFTWAVFSNPTAIGTFIALYVITLLSYVLSRTRLFSHRDLFLLIRNTSLAFFSLYFGTASSFDSAISSIAHVSLILASILLSLRGFSILVLLSTIAIFSARSYSQTPHYRRDGFFLEWQVYSCPLASFSSGPMSSAPRVERDRLKEVQDINSELEDIKNKLEQRVEERTAELESANLQTSQRRLTVADNHPTIRSYRATAGLGRYFPNCYKPPSVSGFGFYHVGIFLVDQNREYAILQAANSEGGKRMLGAQASTEIWDWGCGRCSAKLASLASLWTLGRMPFSLDNPNLPTRALKLLCP
jgi:hypothetical protein